MMEHTRGTTLRVRVATAADAAILAGQRADMFRDMGRLDAADVRPTGVRVGGVFCARDPTGELRRMGRDGRRRDRHADRRCGCTGSHDCSPPQ